MNILVVAGIFPPDAGGPATYVPTVARPSRAGVTGDGRHDERRRR